MKFNEALHVFIMNIPVSGQHRLKLHKAVFMPVVEFKIMWPVWKISFQQWP